MMKLSNRFSLICIVIAMGVLGCESKEDTPLTTSDKVSVVVSIEPQAYFVERLGAEHVDFTVLVPPGSSPHTYEPTPHQMTRLAEARLYFSIGVPFEQILLKKITATFENLEIVDTCRGIQR